MIVLSTIPVDGSYVNLIAGLLPISIGLGLTFAPATLLGTSGVQEQDAGLASGLLNTAQQVGGAIGLAVLSTLASNRTSSVLGALHHAPSRAAALSAQIDGYHVAFIGGGILFTAGLVIGVTMLRQRHLDQLSTESLVAEAA
jgi:hypothetical protein